jgi:transposase
MTVRMTDTPKNVEVITSMQQRRRWSAAEKMRMVEESLKPGATVSLATRRHGANPNQLFTWRRLAAHGAFRCSCRRRGSVGRAPRPRAPLSGLRPDAARP